MSYTGQTCTNTDPDSVHSVSEWLPHRNEVFCHCWNKDDSWYEPAYWKDYKFWIIKGFLKGKELPFVTHWSYMSSEQFKKLKASE